MATIPANFKIHIINQKTNVQNQELEIREKWNSFVQQILNNEEFKSEILAVFLDLFYQSYSNNDGVLSKE